MNNILNVARLLILVIPIVTIITAIIGFRKFKLSYGKYQSQVFYPPNNLSSADVSSIYKGFSTNEDIISTLFSLANKGFVAFQNYGSNLEVNFWLRKQKEYNLDDKLEKYIMEALFKDSMEIEIKRLEDYYAIIYNYAKDEIDRRSKKKMHYDKNVLDLKLFILFLSLISMSIINVEAFDAIFDNMYLAIACAVGISLPIMTILKGNSSIKYIGYLSIFVSLILNVLYLNFENFSFSIHVIGIILIMFSLFLQSNYEMRTVSGKKLMNSILYFRKFLENITVDEAYEITQKYPNYFYLLLPYVIAFDLRDEWFKKFNGVVLYPPEWFDSGDDFSLAKLNIFIKTLTGRLKLTNLKLQYDVDQIMMQLANRNM